MDFNRRPIDTFSVGLVGGILLLLNNFYLTLQILYKKTFYGHLPPTSYLYVHNPAGKRGRGA